jgi:hypothetical protein
MRSPPLARRMILALALAAAIAACGSSRSSSVSHTASAAPSTASASATVTAVHLISATQATVTYDIYLGGKPALRNQTGTAVSRDGPGR